MSTERAGGLEALQREFFKVTCRHAQDGGCCCEQRAELCAQALAPHIAAAKEREEKLWALVDKLKSSKAHTYASENADHYRGFDVGQLRAAESLEALLKASGIKRP